MVIQEFESFLVQEMQIEPDVAEKMVADLVECSEDWLMLSVIDLLREQDAQDFDHLIQSGAPGDVVTKFLYNRIPRIEEKLQERFDLFLQELMESVRNVRTADEERERRECEKVEQEKKKAEHEKYLNRPLAQIDKEIATAVSKADWATAARLIQEKKKRFLKI